jgi:tripartite-type tricarboxylate transporter receptor subunit TctC
MPLMSCLARVIAAGLIVLAARGLAAAQDVAGLYKGKTINLTIGGRPGGDDDIYARLLAKHLSKHIPGNPAIAASNMPGSGGHVAAAYIYSAAAKDGTAIGAVAPGTITEPLWFGLGQVQHDPSKFIYLGSAESESNNCFVRSDTPIRTLRDAFAGDVVMGAAADGGPTRDGPTLLNSILGTKFRVVATYSGTSEILAAIEKGDVVGVCGVTSSSVSARRPDWIPKGVLRGLVQESVTGSALGTRLGIPLAVEFAKSATDREVMALAYAQQAFGRPYILPPGTPPERATALRKALMATLQDAALLADAKQAFVQIDPRSGEDVEALVAQLYETPPQTIDRVRAALAGQGAH